MFSQQNEAKGKATSGCNWEVLHRELGFGESVGFFSPGETSWAQAKLQPAVAMLILTLHTAAVMPFVPNTSQ